MGDIGVSPADEMSAPFQVAARLAAITDIRDIRLLKSRVEMVRSPADSPFLAYHLDSESAVEYEPGTESFVVRGTYRVSITSSSTADAGNGFTSDDSNSTVARIEFEQAALFVMEIEGGQPPNADELNAYAVSTGQYALYPYAREYISDLTMRLGLPPLTIGVLKIPLNAGQ